ncbi:MAG TPA: glycosyltransferase family 4 protein, partial [Roseiflexaceae bacterium]|nr:glycosyltransferase family 4 protein [Roseiflexaceae bacterium]
MSPLSVLLVSAEYPPDPGGVGDYTRCLAGALRQRGQRVSVLTAHNGQAQLVGASEERQSLGQALHWQWDTLRAVQAAIAAVQPEIVHVQFQAGAYGMHPAILALPSLLRRTGIQAPLLVTMHDLLVPYLFPKAGPIRSWALRRMMLAADQVVVTNETDYARLAVGNSQAVDLPLYNGRALPQARRPALIPIGSNIALDPPPSYNRDEWRSRLGVAADTTLLAYFGLVSPTKGLDTVLDALAFLPPNVRLLVIGGEAGGPQDTAYTTALQRRIATPQLRERVTITGHCDAHDVSAYLLSADIGVLPFRDGASFRR